MKRTLWNRLLEWKCSKHRKPLIISGARQVGKTWLMRKFGQELYEDVIYINCDDEPRATQLFADDYDIDRILLQLQAISHIMPRPGKTLIIFDEIQALPRGLASLKYFYEKAPEHHVMVAGSLLGIALHEGTSFPIGKVDMLTLNPMSFREFLMAMDYEDWAMLIEQKDWATLDVVSHKLENLLRQYYYVGGMPEIVSNYVDESNLADVRVQQNMILDAYRNDISKHAPREQVPRINMVMRSIPSQLAKENKKFIYGALKPGGRAKEFELSIQWLIDCGIIHKISCVTQAKAPLSFYEDLSAFKLYFLDCGLFGALAGISSEQVLVSNSIFSDYKGAFTEQYVLQQLKSHGYRDIYYWTSGATAEVDFIIERNGKVIPIEVKAESNVKAKSLRLLVSRYPDLRGTRFSMQGYKEQDWLVNYPLYAL